MSDAANRLGQILAMILISLGVLFQMRVLLDGRLGVALAYSPAERNRPAWQRGAQALEGSDFASYLEFVRDHVPPDAQVMLPPRTVVSPYAHIYLMQYFLYPRRLHNCGPNEVEACMGRIQTNPEFYILGLRHFPPRDLAEIGKDYVPFNDDIGVFVPSN